MANGVKTGGRTKGTPNKTTALLKDAILQAAEGAGDGDLVAYLSVQAIENPTAFLTLLGKVLPLQVMGDLSMTHEAGDSVFALMKAIDGRTRSKP